MTKEMFNRLKIVSGIAMAAFLLVASVFTARAQTAYTFSSNSSVTINDVAPASPYPSGLNVSNVPTDVTRVTVKLKGFSHAYPEDVGVILVSPSGQKALLFTNCMGDGGGNGVYNLDLTFDDYAPTALPDNPLTATPPGTYKTKKGTSDGVSPEHPANFASPAPAGPYSETLSTFNHINPNGNWQLFVDDDSAGGTGVIQNGWDLTIYAMQPTSGTAVISGNISSGGLRGGFIIAQLVMTDQYGVQTFTNSNLNGNYSFPAAQVGQSYTIRITAKGHNFSPSSQVVNLMQDTTLNWRSTN